MTLLNLSDNCLTSVSYTHLDVYKRQGFKLTEGSFDILHQKRIWFILEILSKDPDPTPEYENKYGGKNMDPATMSINTTRGFAMHAVMKYALWVKKNLEKLSKHNDDFIFNLDLIPEVKKILGEHLDIKKDPSLTIRACLLYTSSPGTENFNLK